MSIPVRAVVTRALALSLAFSLSPQTTYAAEPQSSADELPEVVVTAQFIEQNVQDTPIAITAVNAQMLESRSQVSVEQIANQAPNVTLKAAGANYGPSLIGFIRGVGQTDFNPALEPGVGLYVDDVYFSTLTGSVLDLLDLDRIEVLRGPQGTLAGKNSIGGSIKLYSKKPSAEGDGFVEVASGNYNALTVRGGSDLTVVEDTLFARVAGVSRTREGYVKRMDYGCTHPGSGVPVYSVHGQDDCRLGTEGGISYTAGRLSLRWLASDNLEVNFAADAVRDRSEAPANILMSVGTASTQFGLDTDNNPATGDASGLDIVWNAPAPNGPCRFIAYGANSCDPQSPKSPYVNYATYTDPRAPGSGGLSSSLWSGFAVEPIQTLTAKGLSASIDWKLNEQLQLQSITAWRKYNSSFADDADATPLVGELLLQTLVHDQKSQELRLNGKLGTLLDYTVGAFYFDQNTDEDARVDIPYAPLDFLHGPDLVPAKTTAVFAHGIFSLGAQTNVAVGLRRTTEKKDYTYQRHNPDGTDIPGIPPCFVDPTPGPTTHNCFLTGLNGNVGKFKDSRTDLRLAVDHKWTEDLMTYAQFTTGYKGGGINPRPFNPNQVLSFDPETLRAYEIGVKSQLLHGKLRANAALFFNQYKDIQLQLTECSAQAGVGSGSPCLLPANVGNADVKGGELEVYWLPVAGLQMDGAFSKLDFKYTNIDPATFVPEDGISPYTPEIKWSLGAQYSLHTAGGSSITPRVDASYQSKVFSNAVNSAAGGIEGYALLNGRVTWQSADNAWAVSFEGLNLADKVYFTTKYDLIAAGGGYQSGTPGLPRTWAFTIKRRF